MTIQDAEARVAEAKRQWLDAVDVGIAWRMNDKAKALDLAEEALERALWATDDEDEEVGELPDIIAAHVAGSDRDKGAHYTDDLYYKGERSRPAYPAPECEPRHDPES